MKLIICNVYNYNIYINVTIFMEFSNLTTDFLEKYYPTADIYSMNLEELKLFKEEISHKRDEFYMLELAMKSLGNAAYGASANEFFYFWNVTLAGDITGECRNLTKSMWRNLDDWLHEGIWERKDLWEKFDFELDESKHDWYRQQPTSIYSDTDSVYTTFGTFFQAMTPKSQAKYDTDSKKLEWILDYFKRFQNEKNFNWCSEIYNPRNGNNIHEFELETVSKSGIYLKKKKYLKGIVFSKGNYYEHPKVSGTGIELIKSTTPKLCRKILKDLMESLMFEFDNSTKELTEEYIILFNNKLSQYKKEFYTAPIEDISMSIGIGDYKKYVLNDEDKLELGKACPISVHSIARFNWLAHQNHEDNKKIYSGKIKYYNINLNGQSGKKAQIGYFGFPAGELPEWAPKIDKMTQWKKTVIDPINRFLEVMKIPLATETGTVQLTFDF